MSNYLFLGTEDDKPHLAYLKTPMGQNKCYLNLSPVSTIAEVELFCRSSERNITKVISTSLPLLQRITGSDKAKIDNYAGSYFKRNGIEYVFVSPLLQVHTIPYGKFLLERFISKLTKPEKWIPTIPFNWRVVTYESQFTDCIRFLSNSDFIATDIETFSSPLAIRCIGYTGFQLGSSVADTKSSTYVIPIDTIQRYQWMKSINALPVPKVFQNGKYDHSYLCRFDAVCSHWYWDTINEFHAWYSELPKDLGFLQSFFVREAAYWKDLADSSNLEDYYLYNGKDTWATGMAHIAWLHESPEWAKKNYLKKFPQNFPAHMCEMRGLKRDTAILTSARTELLAAADAKEQALQTTLGCPDFNCGSPKQMKSLMRILGCGDLDGADDKALATAAFRHPLNAHIIDYIRGVPKSDDISKMGIRAIRKVVSTYLNPDKDFHERILYAINPHGTDSGRNASKDHHFWTGIQIQNIPVGKNVKQTIVADPDFYIGESDLEQAETRDTAYITGDPALIAAVNSGRDFHSQNTAAFFGVPYESVYDDATSTVLNKPLRNLAKRVNHGANYNMGPKVMVDTMGEKTIYEAGRLLKLPRGLTAIQIAENLLERFAKTYPVVRHDYQQWIITTIKTTKMLVGATGWTRYCFSDPSKSKPALNSYIAHCPQSLNAMVLDIAFLRVFNEIALSPKYGPYFKLQAQIHDSILFQYHKDHTYLPEMVKERMEIPIDVTDISGVTRQLTVPAALKIGKIDKKSGELIRATRWSETE